MGERIKVWTKQHENVLKALNETGRYTAKREYIQMDLKEHAHIMLEAYDWLVRHSPNAGQKPADVTYPVWVSFQRETTMLPSPGTVILELEIEKDSIAYVNIEKWGTILNYSYIPADKEDAKRHRALCAAYGVSDTKAYMTQFYPEIKREIIKSWDRLFDDSIVIGNDLAYGIIWELRKEWVTDIAERG